MLSRTTTLMLYMKPFPRILATPAHKDFRRGEKCHSHSLPSLLYPSLSRVLTSHTEPEEPEDTFPNPSYTLISNQEEEEEGRGGGGGGGGGESEEEDDYI
jgi:hypothetical protein